MISMQMNNTRIARSTSWRRICGNLSARMPDLPLTEVLLCRLMLHMGREMAAMLEQEIRPFGLAEAEFRVLTTLFSQPDGRGAPQRSVRARGAESRQHVAHQRCVGEPRPHYPRAQRSGPASHGVAHHRAGRGAGAPAAAQDVRAAARASMQTFPEAEQRQMIEQLKRLGDAISPRRTRIASERAL